MSHFRSLSGRFFFSNAPVTYGEQKTDKEKSHKGIWWWECPRSVPGINSGRPRDTRDVWADLCGNSHSRGRMSAGQTGQMTGQTGHVPGTDGTQTRGCPTKILYVYWFFSFSITFNFWANPGVLWKKAPRAIRAMRGKTLQTVPLKGISTVLWVHQKLPQSTVSQAFPSKKSYESKAGCNRTPATVLWAPLNFDKLLWQDSFPGRVVGIFLNPLLPNLHVVT